MKTPVFTFEAEILTDAPFEVIAARLRGDAAFGAWPSLRRLGAWAPLNEASEGLELAWAREAWGAEERGVIRVRPDAKGAHLRLEGHLRGWSGFLRLGLLRWHTDRLLDRFVEDL